MVNFLKYPLSNTRSPSYFSPSHDLFARFLVLQLRSVGGGLHAGRALGLPCGGCCCRHALGQHLVGGDRRDVLEDVSGDQRAVTRQWQAYWRKRPEAAQGSLPSKGRQRPQHTAPHTPTTSRCSSCEAVCARMHHSRLYDTPPRRPLVYTFCHCTSRLSFLQQPLCRV